MPHNSIRPIKSCPLRRGHNVQFSSEMTLTGVKTHQQHQVQPALVIDKRPGLLWVVDSVLRPYDINSNNPESLLQGQSADNWALQHWCCFWREQRTECLADNLNDTETKAFPLKQLILRLQERRKTAAANLGQTDCKCIYSLLKMLFKHWKERVMSLQNLLICVLKTWRGFRTDNRLCNRSVWVLWGCCFLTIQSVNKSIHKP